MGKSHCSCDDLFYQCLKRITLDEDEEARDLANNIGRVYFNIFRLECAEADYPKKCTKTTQALPGSKSHEVLPSVPQKRFFFESNQREAKDWEDVCTEWVVDTSAMPNLKFRKPKV